jgi:hypothetical protein
MKQEIKLTDDGTMDTVLRCSACGQEFRFNFPLDGELERRIYYDAWVQDCIDEIGDEHVCGFPIAVFRPTASSPPLVLPVFRK